VKLQKKSKKTMMKIQQEMKIQKEMTTKEHHRGTSIWRTRQKVKILKLL